MSDAPQTADRISISIAVILLLAGCNPAAEAVDQPNAQNLADKITYIKDKHGLCYATIATYSYGAYSVASITNVPCEKVGL